MKKRHLVVATACVALGALTLAACGGSSGSSGSSSGGSAKKITFMFRGGTDEKAAYQKAIDRYTAATGVQVEMIVTDADQYATKLQAAVSGNKARLN